MDYSEWLSNLKIGDFVVVMDSERKWSWYLSKVKRITKDYIAIRFRSIFDRHLTNNIDACDTLFSRTTGISDIDIFTIRPPTTEDLSILLKRYKVSELISSSIKIELMLPESMRNE